MKVDVKRIDHWGIVAGVIKDLGLIDLVNQQIGVDKQEILTTGDVVAGLVINGLGFASRPLTLAPQFFENKALEVLIKPGINAEHFNRHKIGRTLDTISKFGCEKLFNFLAFSACEKEGVITKFGHADTTSFSLHGDYNSEELDENGKQIEQKISITHGYSKANRPDLKQVIQELVTSQDGGIPFITKTLSGNISDTIILRERAKVLMEEFSTNTSRCLVADCKLYASGTAEALNNINFITRVPAAIKLTQEYIEKSLTQKEDWIDCSDGYKVQEFKTNLFNIQNQRWFVFYSQQAYDRSKKTLAKELVKEEKHVKKDIAKIQNKKFGCEGDAITALNTLAKKWRYHSILDTQVTSIKRFKTPGKPTEITDYETKYKINVATIFDEDVYQKTLDQRSCFILSSNMSIEKLTASEALIAYKGQDHTEKGFAFLKKKEFFTSSLNLEKPGRIEAILMIMVLSLLVYSIAQRRLRKVLALKNQTVPNQVKKPIKNPTMRWIFQLFEGVNLVSIEINNIETRLVEGLSDVRRQVVVLLGENVFNIYHYTTFQG